MLLEQRVMANAYSMMYSLRMKLSLLGGVVYGRQIMRGISEQTDFRLC